MNEEEKFLKSINFKKISKTLIQKLKGKKILIYGAGKMFETALEKYDLSKLNIIGVADKRFECSKEPFCGFKTYAPQEIKNTDADCIVVSIKNYSGIVEEFKNLYPKKEIYGLYDNGKMSLTTFNMLVKRNFRRNVDIEMGKNPNFRNSFFSDEIRGLLLLKEKLSFFLTKKLNIPQIEFVLTTKCTLRCKDCLNYIPQIGNNEHVAISLDDFKIQLKNLTANINKIKKLILIGGETFLVKNLEEYLEVAANNKKVENVWIFTNGTLPINPNLINIAKKYKTKTTFYISNYSKNEAIKDKLKYDDIISKLEKEGISFIFDKTLSWEFASPLPQKAIRKNDISYFAKCTNPCISVLGGKMFVCPRAGTFAVKNIYKPFNTDYIDLNIRFDSKTLIDFFSKNHFTACDYCSVLEDKLKPHIVPAIQIEDGE